MNKQLSGIETRLNALQKRQQTAPTTTANSAKFPRRHTAATTSKSRNDDIEEKELVVSHHVGLKREISALETQVEHLTAENQHLKAELEKSKQTCQKVFQESHKMRSNHLKLNEAKTEAKLYKDQVSTLQNLLERQSKDHQVELNALMQELERTAVSELRPTRLRESNGLSGGKVEESIAPTPDVRNEAVKERLKEVQEENLELRRRMAGLTPQATPGGELIKRRHLVAEKETPSKISCGGCKQLKRQKTKQADYFECKLLEARSAAIENREKCKELADEIHSLRDIIERLGEIYSSKTEKLEQRAGLYKDRSERLEKFNSSSLKGLRSDVRDIRSRVGHVEKEVIKRQLRAADREQDDVINEELGRLMVQSSGAEQKLRALQRSLGIVETMKF